ncbi:MAG: hypothetical protein K2H43_06000 [Clostridia bacterium]|nr:hypothetical protein [Clostridia bacterium]
MKKRNAVKSAAVLLSAFVCAVFALFLVHSPVFFGGRGYELYAGASSSACILETENPACDKILLGGVSGESVRYDGNRVSELLRRYRAKVLFTEEAGGVINYYCYSPLLGKGIGLYGATVNFHVAAGEKQTAAGTPIIFGGF